MKGRNTNWIFGVIGGAVLVMVTGIEVLAFTATEGAPWVLIPMLGIMQAVGLVLVVLFLKGVFRGAREREAEQFGKDATAELVRIELRVSVNTKAHYRVIFTFIGDEGYVTYKTQPCYFEHEVRYLEKLHTFSVRYKGRFAVITEDLDKADRTEP